MEDKMKAASDFTVDQLITIRDILGDGVVSYPGSMYADDLLEIINVCQKRLDLPIFKDTKHFCDFSEQTKELKAGEVLLYNERLIQFYRFQSLKLACKRAIEAGRTAQNGWNIIDAMGNTYEKSDWALLATLQ